MSVMRGVLWAVVLSVPCWVLVYGFAEALASLAGVVTR